MTPSESRYRLVGWLSMMQMSCFTASHWALWVSQENIPQTIILPLASSTVDPWQARTRFLKFWPSHLNVTVEIKTHQTRQLSSGLKIWWTAICILSFPFQTDRSSVFCGLLLLLPVISGCLSHCCLPINSKQFGHSLLTSCINKAFVTWYFLLFSEKPTHGYVGKS